MAAFNSKERFLPGAYIEAITEPRTLAASYVWEPLRDLLLQHRPVGLGLVMPFSWQMHWYAYHAARAQGIVTAVAMPTNPSALSGLMRGLPLDAVITSIAGAHLLQEDLLAEGLLEHIRVWIIAAPQGTPQTFTPSQGVVAYIDLP